jgi:hypothetical protein
MGARPRNLATFYTALKDTVPSLETQIVKCSDRIKGFVAQAKRLIVERSIARLDRCRRSAQDGETLNAPRSLSSNALPSVSCCEDSAIHGKLSERARKAMACERYWTARCVIDKVMSMMKTFPEVAHAVAVRARTGRMK